MWCCRSWHAAVICKTRRAVCAGRSRSESGSQETPVHRPGHSLWRQHRRRPGAERAAAEHQPVLHPDADRGRRGAGRYPHPRRWSGGRGLGEAFGGFAASGLRRHRRRSRRDHSLPRHPAGPVPRRAGHRCPGSGQRRRRAGGRRGAGQARRELHAA
ncbi:UNVERIFIED_CONTAM: hypothetical protein NCL1_61619 [Trichonephila clavipes]